MAKLIRSKFLSFEAATQIDPLSAFTKLQNTNPAPEAFVKNQRVFDRQLFSGSGDS